MRIEFEIPDKAIPVLKTAVLSLLLIPLAAAALYINYHGHSMRNIGVWEGYSLTNNIMMRFILLPVIILVMSVLLRLLCHGSKTWVFGSLALSVFLYLQRWYYVWAYLEFSFEPAMRMSSFLEILDGLIQLALCVLLSMNGISLFLKMRSAAGKRPSKSTA